MKENPDTIEQPIAPDLEREVLRGNLSGLEAEEEMSCRDDFTLLMERIDDLNADR